MPQHTIRRISMLLLTLVCFSLFLGQALAAENTFHIYAPVVLKPGQPPAVTPTGQPVPSDTLTATHTATATTAPSDTATATHTATATTAPSDTPTATHTATATTAPSDTPTATHTTTATTTSTPSATSTATSTPTNTPSITPTNDPTRTLTGNVWLRPMEPVSSHVRAYVIVLDVSGSMTLNFNGQAIINGEVRQCGAAPDRDVSKQREADAPICAASIDDLWYPVEERRIYIAKQALMQFIDQIGPNDWLQLIAFSGNGVRSVGTAEYGDATGKTRLKQYVLDAGKVSSTSDPYVVRGGTPTATGLYRARQLLTGSTMPVRAPNGLPYKNTVVLMTDGVANFYRDMTNGRYIVNSQAVGWWNQAQDQQPHCSGDVSERVDCQIGYADTTLGQIARPITAMVNEGMELRQIAEVYVVAMAGVDTTGLAYVATRPDEPWFARADRPESVAAVFSTIRENAQLAEMSDWMGQIDQDHAPDPATLPDVDATTFGFVTLTNWSGTATLAAPIQIDPLTGLLTYRFTGLEDTNYVLRAWIGYKSNDGITRSYRVLTTPERAEYEDGIVIHPWFPPSGELRQDVFLVR